MLRRVLAFGFTAALLLTLLPAAAFAQAQRGSISVTVTSDDGTLLPGATVTAASDETLTRREAQTDAQGVALLPGLDPAANYVVRVSLDGLGVVENRGVRVRAGQDAPLAIVLRPTTVTGEEITVTSDAPVVDVTSAITGEDITLQLTESLPTARSYQDYLQLVPGVLPSDSDNPASRSGLNYDDVGGDIGTSTDNYYYFEGINVTDGVTGTFGANLNTEIIQEQSVLTGGIPAEYAGAPGLISNVITKSGGNRLSGSVNYYFQDDGLVADDENEPDASFSTFDSAITLGGPIVRDKAWWFGSFRHVEREEDVVDFQTGKLLRTPTEEADQGFAKITWAPTQRDLFSGLFLSDPQQDDGSFNNQLSNARDIATDQGGERWSADYARIQGAWSLEAAVSKHDSSLDRLPNIAEIRNDVIFPSDENPTLEQGQLGGLGQVFLEERGTESARASAERLFDTGRGDHTVKAGIELSEYNDFRDQQYLGDPPALYASLTSDVAGQGISARDVIEGFDDIRFDPSVQDDYTGLLEAIDASPNRADLIALLDSNGDGLVSQDEALDNIRFGDTTGNPNGQVNYFRDREVAPGAQDTSSEGRVAFLQDQWQWNRWSVNAGVRAEEWSHLATTGEEIFTFDWELAPRVSLAYDVTGDGRQRASLFFGRYYDPIRNNLTNFAGTLTGQRTEEQVFVNGEWLTFRVRGGAVQQDAVFTPTTQTPYTDEYQAGYKIDLGRNMSLESNLIHRRTADIVEDFFLELYADPDVYPGPVDHPDSLFLGLDYFGLTEFPENINFFIGTLPGAVREYDGLELIFRKRYSNRWQALASYNYADVTGNSNSDSAADFAGDVLFLDPRAPNVRGRQPGSIEHLLKLQGSYTFDLGLTVGAAYRWNSGTAASRTFRASQRNLPVRVDTPFEFAGITNTRWVAPDTVGVLDNPEFGLLDLRVAYLWDVTERLDADLFVDVFNALDDQGATRTQDLVAGQPGFPFGSGLAFNDPRRYYLGARLRF